MSDEVNTENQPGNDSNVENDLAKTMSDEHGVKNGYPGENKDYSSANGLLKTSSDEHGVKNEDPGENKDHSKANDLPKTSSDEHGVKKENPGKNKDYSSANDLLKTSSDEHGVKNEDPGESKDHSKANDYSNAYNLPKTSSDEHGVKKEDPSENKDQSNADNLPKTSSDEHGAKKEDPSENKDHSKANGLPKTSSDEHGVKNEDPGENKDHSKASNLPKTSSDEHGNEKKDQGVTKGQFNVTNLPKISSDVYSVKSEECEEKKHLLKAKTVDRIHELGRPEVQMTGIENGDMNSVLSEEKSIILCEEHREVMKYYCINCKERKCGDCAFGHRTSLVFHKIIRVSDHLQHQKVLLREACNGLMSQSLSQVEKMLDVTWNQEEMVRLQAMIQQERICQEFTSMRDLLTERENDICQQLNQLLSDSLNKLSLATNTFGRMVDENAQLTARSLEVLDEPESSCSIKNLDSLLERTRTHMKDVRTALHSTNIQDINIPHVNLSLYEEKKYIMESTSSNLSLRNVIKAKRHTMFVPEERVKDPILASEFLSVQCSLPPSTVCTISFRMTSRCGKQSSVVDLCLTSLDSPVVNKSWLPQLSYRQRYVMKFLLKFTTRLSASQESVKEFPIHVFIVTDAMEKPRRYQRFIAANKSIEEIRCMRYMHTVDNYFVISQSSTKMLHRLPIVRRRAIKKEEKKGMQV